MYGRSDYATKAIEEYRLAIDNDPSSDYLNAGLAELYAKTGRIRDAVLEAQDILKRDGNNLEARRLLGSIYLRSLGDMQSGTQSQEILKLAIEQYEQIVKLDPKSVEDHLLLGRLYRLNNELLKSENEFKAAVTIQPDSEEAVTTLAYLYNEEGDSGRALQVLNAIPENARTAKLYSALGYTYEQQKDYKQAVEAYRKSTRTGSRQPGCGSRPGSEPDERRPDRRRAGAVQSRSSMPIPRTRRPTCASPRSIAATASSIRRWMR